MKALLFVPLVVLFSFIPQPAIDTSHDYDQVSVLIHYQDSFGSGVSFHNGNSEFIWTAGHVVAKAEKDTELGTFDEVEVIRYEYDGEKRVSKTTILAEVIRYSCIDNGYDLALLKTKRPSCKKGAEFASNIPKVGTEVYYVGSPMGAAGYNSYIRGIVSAHGRGVKGMQFTHDNPTLYLDQYSLPVMGGASGGPVFDLKTNKVYGLVVRVAANQTIAFIVPTSAIRKFAKENNCEWAVDNKIPVPELE